MNGGLLRATFFDISWLVIRSTRHLFLGYTKPLSLHCDDLQQGHGLLTLLDHFSFLGSHFPPSRTGRSWKKEEPTPPALVKNLTVYLEERRALLVTESFSVSFFGLYSLAL